MIPPDPLANVTLASPCPASWDAMEGDDRSRFCALCGKQVYNLVSMTTSDALALIEAHEGELCGRLVRRRDGTVLTADCPVGLKSKKARRWRRMALGGVMLAILAQSGAVLLGRVTLRRAWDHVPPMPSGSNVTLHDWSRWVRIALGIDKQPHVYLGGLSTRNAGEIVSADEY
jgi:hypothetical protein